MAIDLFNLLQTLWSQCNVQQGGQIRPEQDFQNWVNAISEELFKKYVGEFQLNQQVTDQLKPFHYRVNVNVTPQPGYPYDLVVLPSNYEYLAGLRFLKQKDENTCGYLPGIPLIDCDGNCMSVTDPDYIAMIAKFAGQNLIESTINVIDTARWGSCLAHLRKGPTWDNPKATQYSGGFQIAPKGITSVVVDYFKAPTPAVFAYTYGADDIIVYNPGGSTQLEWSKVVINEFIIRLMKKYGAAVREDSFYQMANEDKKQLG